MPNVSGTVREFIANRVLDPQTGFAYWAQRLAGSQDYPDTTQFAVDDTTVHQLAVDEREIDDTNIDFTYPMFIIRSVSADSQVYRSTPAAFSGDVYTMIDAYMSWPEATIPDNTEEWMDLFEDAMVETFNRYDEFSLYQATDITYNNEIKWTRGKFTRGGLFWRQKTTFIIKMNMPSLQPR